MHAVLLHPHPDMGGDQHNNVVSALYAGLGSAHRFDFRSSDLRVATAQVLDELGEDPAWLVGYSFGGGVASLVDDPRVLGWVLVAPALSMVTPVIAADPRPKLVLAAEHDRFFAPAALVDATAGWAATDHAVVSGTDHFFAGHERTVVDRTLAFLTAHP